MIEVEINCRLNDAQAGFLDFDLGIDFPLHPNYSTSVKVWNQLPLKRTSSLREDHGNCEAGFILDTDTDADTDASANHIKQSPLRHIKDNLQKHISLKIKAKDQSRNSKAQNKKSNSTKPKKGKPSPKTENQRRPQTKDQRPETKHRRPKTRDPRSNTKTKTSKTAQAQTQAQALAQTLSLFTVRCKRNPPQWPPSRSETSFSAASSPDSSR